VDCCCFSGYTMSEVEAMKNLILDYNLLNICRGVVLPVCARLLYKNCGVFDSILRDLPGIQLLVWTATGEPPISIQQINSIKSHFNSTGYSEKVGFDCKVASSLVTGFLYDNLVKLTRVVQILIR